MTCESKPDDLVIRRLHTNLSPRRLYLILMPTEQCNFRCTYCYERFDLGEMSPSVVEGVKNLLEKRAPTLDHLVISWFGGEPLAARSVILDLGRFIQQVLERYPNIEYLANMTTNGYLLSPQTCAELCDLGISEFQISLDGPEAVHNKTRILKNGHGTFEQIWQNLISLKESSLPFRIFIRLHFQKSTFPDLQDFAKTLNDTFGTDERFSMIIKGIERLGGENDGDIEVLSKDEKVAMKGTLADQACNFFAAEPSSSPSENEQICYACLGNSFVIRANGRINKCTVALYSDENDIGYISENGDLHIDDRKFAAWTNPLFENDADALKCPHFANAIDLVSLPQKLAF